MPGIFYFSPMQNKSLIITIILTILTTALLAAQDKFSEYPQTQIENDKVTMKLYLPDPENGYYRATRFDWSGVIHSLEYKGHEYFGEWKETHDPLVFEDITGPVESYIDPGLGYEEAKPGEGFIRIGVGVLEKPEEEEYVWMKTYPFLDHGSWKVDQGDDWIHFTHEVQYKDYGYLYEKKIELKKEEPGFRIIHHLTNTGKKRIMTDQYNHNFFVIDAEKSGPAFSIKYPYKISTDDDLKGLMEIDDKTLSFIETLDDNSIWMELFGYTDEVEDHKVTVTNHNSGAGITFTLDKPVYRMVFWACETTLSPENFIFISVAPGEKETWTSAYTVFVEE